MITAAASGPLGHVALVHEDPERAEDLARLLRTAGHRVTVVVPGRRIVQGVVDCSPDLLLASHSLVDPPMASVVKGVRQALGADVRILVLYGFDPQGVPARGRRRAARRAAAADRAFDPRVAAAAGARRAPRAPEEDERAARPLQDVLGLLARRRRRRALRPPLAPQRRDAQGRARAGDAVRRRAAPDRGARCPASASRPSRCGASATWSTARPTRAGTSARTGRCSRTRRTPTPA